MINELLTPILFRVINDSELETILGDRPQAVKGPRKTNNMQNPCFTIHRLTSPHDPNYNTTSGTIVINFYADNYDSGNANVGLLGPVEERLIELFDDNLIEMDGYKNYNLHVQNTNGPLWDSQAPEEHFVSVRLRYNILKE